MDDLAKRISAAIDEDERAAQEQLDAFRRTHGDAALVFEMTEGPRWSSVVQARRVLRRVAADRKILDEHESYSGYGEHCQTCHRLDDLAGDPWPCMTLRLLAEAYGVDPGQ